MRGSIGVHAAHCCKWHGCKYGDTDWRVYIGEVEHEYPCEYCSELLREEEYYTRTARDITEIKAWWENKKKNGK
jgi:hypothetical protein